MRRSSRIAFQISWLVFAVVVVLAWRKILAAPNGDITRLLVATLCGAFGLALLGAWLQAYESTQHRARGGAKDRPVG